MDEQYGLMKEERDELAFGASREGGKPLCDSREEVTCAIDGVKRCVETIRTEQGHVVPIAGTEAGARRLAFTQKEPIGPVVAVSAFNHPLNLIVHQVAAAVAAGCPSSSNPRRILRSPASASCSEIFGPVVCLYAYEELDEAIARANALPYAFQAAVFTRDLDTALRAYKHLDASAIMVNDHTAFRVDGMPFAGLRQSGLGTGASITPLMICRSKRC